jgi:hypothetical protein
MRLRLRGTWLACGDLCDSEAVGGDRVTGYIESKHDEGFMAGFW